MLFIRNAKVGGARMLLYRASTLGFQYDLITEVFGAINLYF